MNLTPRESETLRVYFDCGSQKEAAYRLGMNLQTLKNTVWHAYRKLGVGSALEAAQALGWLRLPRPNLTAIFDHDAASALGQGMTEYALILALVAMVAVVALLALGGNISSMLAMIASSV